jgi:hypothetical protein
MNINKAYELITKTNNLINNNIVNSNDKIYDIVLNIFNHDNTKTIVRDIYSDLINIDYEHNNTYNIFSKKIIDNIIFNILKKKKLSNGKFNIILLIFSCLTERRENSQNVIYLSSLMYIVDNIVLKLNDIDPNTNELYEKIYEYVNDYNDHEFQEYIDDVLKGV